MATLNASNGRAPILVGEQHRADDVGDMDVRFALLAVAEDAELCRVLAQPADEVEADAVRLPPADDVAEAEGTAARCRTCEQ